MGKAPDRHAGLEAIRGVKTVNEIGQQYGVHPVLVGQWKRGIRAQAESLFAQQRGPPTDDDPGDADRHDSAIGHLKVELDWL